MAVGNLGAVMNQMQGFIASEFLTTSNQGLSLFPEMVRQVLSRADLAEANARCTAPRLFDGTNDVTVETTAARLVGVVAQSLAAQVENCAILFYNAAVTEGTTKYEAAVMVNADNTAAGARAVAVVYAEPVEFSSTLRWSIVDNGADTDIESTTLADANGVRVMLVYVE